MLRLAASLPDALVGLAPHGDGARRLGLHDRPQPPEALAAAVWSRMESTPLYTSFWRWSKAPLPMRTGLAPA